jgi:hypothetical protein
MLDTSRKSKLKEALDAVRRDFEAAVMREIEAHPLWPYWRVGEHVGMSEASVLKIAQNNNISHPVGPRPKTEIPEEVALQHGEAASAIGEGAHLPSE